MTIIQTTPPGIHILPNDGKPGEDVFEAPSMCIVVYERTVFRGAYLVRENPDGVVMPQIQERVDRLVDATGAAKKRLEKIQAWLEANGHKLGDVSDTVWAMTQARIREPGFSPQVFSGMWAMMKNMW